MSTAAHNIAASPALPSAAAISLSELPAQRDIPVAPAMLEDKNPLHGVKTRLRVSVGEFELSIGELLSATAGQVFALDRTLNQPVDLILEGQVVMRGQLVAVDGHFGIRVTELPVPLKP